MEITEIKAKRAYVDTNIFIYLIEKHPVYIESVVLLIEHLEALSCEIITSELTLAECLVKPYADEDKASQLSYINAIQTSNFLEVKPVSMNVLIKAARLRAELNNKLPDSIHLATAIENGCDIFIGNDKSIRVNSEIGLFIIG